MDYQARLNDILEKVRKGGVYDVMPEYERQSDYLDTDEAQEVITALFLESVGEDDKEKIENGNFDLNAIQLNALRHVIRSKWQTNQEDGE